MRWLGWAVLGSLGGCATVNHIQVGEIDATRGVVQPFTLFATSRGADVDDVIGFAADVGGVPVVSDVFAAFSIGPRTGVTTYAPGFVGDLDEQLSAQCPSGRVTGLLVTRASVRAPFVGANEVRITGYCVLDEVKS